MAMTHYIHPNTSAFTICEAPEMSALQALTLPLNSAPTAMALVSPNSTPRGDVPSSVVSTVSTCPLVIANESMISMTSASLVIPNDGTSRYWRVVADIGMHFQTRRLKERTLNYCVLFMMRKTGKNSRILFCDSQASTNVVHLVQSPDAPRNHQERVSTSSCAACMTCYKKNKTLALWSGAEDCSFSILLMRLQKQFSPGILTQGTSRPFGVN